jgi:DNA-3-methyladenine glycosylase
MPAGTIYMYYARGGDSLNVSCRGEGNAVLIKSAFPWFDERSPDATLATMQALNPAPQPDRARPRERLCAGQTLLCRSLALRVPEWTGKAFDPDRFFVEDAGLHPTGIVRARRLGIPEGRDEHLLWRFVDVGYARCCTQNPLTRRSWREGEHYCWVRKRRHRRARASR